MHILRKYKWAILVFVGPTLVLYTYFVMVSIFSTLYYSLTTWDAISKPIFVGFRNYVEAFSNPDFAIVLRNTFVGLALSLLFQVSFGLIFAYLIYRTLRGFRLYRALVFLPVVLSQAAVAMMFTLVFNSDVGPINEILRLIGLEPLTRNWLSDKEVVFYTVLTPMIYQYIGLYVVILLAGMQSISEEIIESARIDGAGSFRVFFNIVIPMQLDIIFICIVMITTGMFKAFEHSYIMTWGGPGVRSAFLGVYMYFKAFVHAQYGRASTIAMVILVAALIITMLFRKIVQRFSY
jgi:raffinose/stachyose/melibiose transport system permease protein